MPENMNVVEFVEKALQDLKVTRDEFRSEAAKTRELEERLRHENEALQSKVQEQEATIQTLQEALATLASAVDTAQSTADGAKSQAARAQQAAGEALDKAMSAIKNLRGDLDGYLPKRGGTIGGNLTVKGVVDGRLKTLKVEGDKKGHASIAAHNLWFGHPDRGKEKGPDKGSRGRALVDRDSRLIINFHSDWSGGAWVHGNLEVEQEIKCETLKQTSSLALKTGVVTLTTEEALAAFAELQPVTFYYRDNPVRRHTGFVAEASPDIVTDEEHTAVLPMDILAVLTQIVQHQQQEIGTLREQLQSREVDPAEEGV